jgi:hypothetical protein
MWQCRKLETTITVCGESTVTCACVHDLLEKKDYKIEAKLYVICAGAVLTPQILFTSGIGSKAPGHYLCEQPLAFCQVVLLQSLIDKIPQKPIANIDDPIPIPKTDPQPQV